MCNQMKKACGHGYCNREKAMRLALLLLLLAATSAWAQTASRVRFQILDLNGDGYLSISEAAGIADVVERFDRADADRDGYLSAREFDRLDRVKLRKGTAKRHVRTSVARDARAAAREAAAESASAETTAGAAAGGSARPASP
jgi:hypothetical protein